MQYFKNSATDKIHAFEDDVKVVSTGGVWSFSTARDKPLSKLPATLQPTAAPVKAPPTLAQQAAAVLMPRGSGAGLILTCASAPALNGIYAIDPVSIAKMTAIAGFIVSTAATPSGAPTFSYPDISGAMHPWTAIEFPRLTQAATRLVYALDMVIAGGATELPDAAATIP